MLIDYRTSEVGSTIHADVCIVGAGPAGISLALALRGTGKKVCLIESGGESLDGATQELYKLQEVGIGSGLAAMRLRYLGGTTNHWEGYCGPLDPLDFEAREWVPNSGWPISRADLDPYYELAHELCELGPYAYDTDALALEHRTYPDYDSTKLETQLWQRSAPTRFGSRYLADLKTAPDLAVYTHANVIALRTNSDANRMTTVELSSLETGAQTPKRSTIHAQNVVLAAGGIENVRLMLASNDVQQEGLGNAKDVVGRYWMQHPWVEAATVVAVDPDRYQAELTTHLFSEYNLPHMNTRVLPGAALSPEAQKRQQLLNLVVTIRGGHSTKTGFHQLKRIGGRLRRAEWPQNIGDKLWDVLSDFGSVIDGVSSRITGERYNGPFLDPTIYAQVEQAPNRDSRIYLGQTKDRFGMPHPIVDWRLGGIEKRTLRNAMQFFGEEFARLEMGRVKIEDWITQPDDSFPEMVAGGGHHMGGTRMSTDPTTGVVDQNCKVHGISNLYIAGSSVFPTVGCINPTLTIVALALRLGDHLKS